MMNLSTSFLTFDYDYDSEKWNLPRGTVPVQLKAQGVPHALWMHFWDYSQSVVERASVRSIMKKKLRAECHQGNLSDHRRQEREAEIIKLDEQTNRDFECLEKQAERLFPNSRARVSNQYGGRQLSLEIRLMSSSSSSGSSTAAATTTVELHYDARHTSWNLPRDIIPTALSDHGVPVADWTAIWDYGFGVNQRAREREHLNQLHERELRLCQKSLSYMNSTKVASVDKNSVSNHNSTANHIKLKMDKLRRAKEANTNNTKKGWQELQRRAAQRFEPYGVKVYLSHPEKEICCGLQFHCPIKQPTPTSKSNDFLSVITGGVGGGNPNKERTKSTFTTPSAIWFPTSSPIPSPPPHPTTDNKEQQQQPQQQQQGLPITSLWMMALPKQQQQQSQQLQQHQQHHLSSKKQQIPRADDLTGTTSTANTTVLGTNNNKTPEKENDPPKPEVSSRKHTKKETSRSVWGQPVVLTYVHDDVPSRIDIEVSAPLTPTSSAVGESFDDEDSHGYVVPPAPSDPSFNTNSSGGGGVVAIHHNKVVPITRKNNKQIIKCVRFGESMWHTYDSPSYSKADRKTLWFSHEEREACRNKTKVLAQRVIDNRNSGGANNVVFMDSETEEEVCWRGLEHAKKGNLSSRQETRRAFLIKVLEKQRLLQLDSWTSRRGTVEDPAAELQQYAARQSRHCRERAQKLAAQDAKDARAVYKESLRRTNLQHNHNSGNTSLVTASSSGCGSQYSKSQPSSSSSASHFHHRQHELHHQNDIFQDYCRQMHLATKARMQQQTVI